MFQHSSQLLYGLIMVSLSLMAFSLLLSISLDFPSKSVTSSSSFSFHLHTWKYVVVPHRCPTFVTYVRFGFSTSSWTRLLSFNHFHLWELTTHLTANWIAFNHVLRYNQLRNIFFKRQIYKKSVKTWRLKIYVS